MSDAHAKSITITTQATKSLNKVLLDMGKAVTALTAQAEINETVATEIEFGTARLAEIQEEISQKERTAAAELKISILENGTAVLETLLNERNMASISVPELAILERNLESATASNESEVKAATAAVTKSITAETAIKLAASNASHSVAVAQKDADLKAQSNQIEYLTKQVASLESQITADREARVAIAASESNKQGVTVQTGKQ